MKLFNKLYLWFRSLFIIKPKALSSVEKYATQYGKVGDDLVQFGSEVKKISSPYREQNKELEVVSSNKDYSSLFSSAYDKHITDKQEKNKEELEKKEKFLQDKEIYVARLIDDAIWRYVNFTDKKEIRVKCKDIFNDDIYNTAKYIDYFVDYINNSSEIDLMVHRDSTSYSGYLIVISRKDLERKLGEVK